jgi:hypothetical protein
VRSEHDTLAELPINISRRAAVRLTLVGSFGLAASSALACPKQQPATENSPEQDQFVPENDYPYFSDEPQPVERPQ